MSLHAQKKVTLTIAHKLGANNFAFNQSSVNDLNQNFKITRIDYYISNIKLVHDGGKVTLVPNHYIFANGSKNVNDELGTFDIKLLESIKFSVGVEAPTNNNDPSIWTAPHPLAPKSPSMHWGWSAGYRFVAIEGSAGTNFNTNFQMHGLENANYFEQTIITTGTNNASAITINLDADYNKALKGININAGPIDHGVNAADLTVLKNFRDYVFAPGAGIANGVKELLNKNEVLIYPNPSNGLVKINILNQNISVTEIQLFDITGRFLETFAVTENTEMSINLDHKGIYFLRLLNNETILANQKLVIE